MVFRELTLQKNLDELVNVRHRNLKMTFQAL